MIRLYDYRKQAWLDVEAPPEDWSPYLPQDPVVQNWYQLLVMRGNGPDGSAVEVFRQCVAGGGYRERA